MDGSTVDGSTVGWFYCRWFYCRWFYCGWFYCRWGVPAVPISTGVVGVVRWMSDTWRAGRQDASWA